jgi:ribonuclease BN (tRNA processing enzyme)
VKLTVVGCSPAWPNPGGVHSGYLVECNGSKLLLDCGPGVLARLRVDGTWPAIDAIAVSHCHLDHVGDLVAWTWGQLVGPGAGATSPQLWLPPGGRREVAALAERFTEVFDVMEYDDGDPFDAAGCRVTPRVVRHGDATAFGFRIEGDGATLAYSGDSGPTPALVDLARDADLFLCEATLAEDDPFDAHLTADQAASAFTQSGARRLLLTHRPDELQLEPGLERAYDGLELVL